MATITVTVDLSGPFTSADIGAALSDMVRECLRVVADQASANVHTNAEMFFRHPTPYYETQIHRFRQGGAELVGDRGVVYGPWLEGTGSRNRTTRFKGYHLWRLATQRTEQEAPHLLRDVVDRHMRQLGGS